MQSTLSFIMPLLNRVKRDSPSRHPQRGATMVEYVLLLILILLVALVAVQSIGQSLSSKYSTVASITGN